MNRIESCKRLWWLIQKDLRVEYRGRHAWPSMLLLGVIFVVVFGLQLDLPSEHRPAAAGTMLWLATLFAGLVAIERTCQAEKQDGCWSQLSLYPIAGSTIFLGKFTVNWMSLLLLQCALVPLMVVLADVPLLQPAWAIALVGTLGSAGIAAVGTLIGVVTDGVRQRAAVLSLLAIPLLVPVVLGAGEATRLVAEQKLGDQWWCWIQFLAAFAVIFVTLGVTMIDGLIEE